MGGNRAGVVLSFPASLGLHEGLCERFREFCRALFGEVFVFGVWQSSRGRRVVVVAVK